MALLFAHDARTHAAYPPRSHSERGKARGHTLREPHNWMRVSCQDAGFVPSFGFRDEFRVSGFGLRFGT
eukprot:5693578-Prymnesium_polylepis.2